MFRIVIFGSRHYQNQDQFDADCDRLLANKHPDIEIVEGDCQGPDKMAEAYAAKRGYKHRKFPADWKGLGKKAGFVRNNQMAHYVAENLPDAGGISFWDGVSKGTAMMIGLLKDQSVPVKIVSVPLLIKGAGRLSSISQQDDPLASIIPAGRPRKRKISPIIVDGEELQPDAPKKKYKPAKTGQTVYKYDYKAIYLAAHEAWFKNEYPHAYKDGHYQPKKVPAVDTANGMASYIIDHAAWTGNYANRINVMGRQVGGFTKTQSGKVFDDRKFIKSSTKKGTPDLDILINGVSIKPEIKIGGDRQSEEQKQQAAKITKAGGVSVVFRSIDDYLDIFFRYSIKQSGLFDTFNT